MDKSKTVLGALLLAFGLLATTTASAKLMDDPPLQPEPECEPGQRYQSNSAYDPCLFPEYFREESAPTSQPIDPAVLANPDLNAAYIQQTPRYDYNAAKKGHEPGDEMIFVATVYNRGSQVTGAFDYLWRMDGLEVASGSHAGLGPGDKVDLFYDWTWASGAHTVTIALDPDNNITEVSELNNVVSDRTDGLAAGFWVEQSVYDWFNANQVYLGIGSNSWDDWAQRQLAHWNEMMAAAVHPLTPAGITEHVRLDKVTILADGQWPNCSNNYWTEDRTVDLVWGFVSELVGVDSGHTCGEFNFYLNHPQFQNIEMPLLHELSHARYLIDLYGLNVYVNKSYLASPVDGAATILPVDRDVQGDGNFPLPVYLAAGGELIICQSKSGFSFTNCARGGEGTTPRAHAAGTQVTLATVRVQDGAGNLVQGSADMPATGDWDDHLYFNRYPLDLMSGGSVYEQHSAYAWNRIAGQRPVCGNYNAPCNIGDYLDDIPAENILELRDKAGAPVEGARVDVFQGKPLAIWYGRHFQKTPDFTIYSDVSGQADLGSFPFGGSSIVHTWGHSTAVVLIKVTVGERVFYRFFEVTEANEAFWSGDQDRAVYSMTLNYAAEQLFLPGVFRDYDPSRPLLEMPFEGSFDGLGGEPGTANGPTFVPGYIGQGASFDDDDTLTYESAGNIHRLQGAIEFWLKPSWDGDDFQSYVFFEVGDSWFNRMRIMKDGANNFRFIVWSADTEKGVFDHVGDWQAGDWHHVRATWAEDSISLSLDGTLRHERNDITLPDSLAAKMYVGSDTSGSMQAQGVIDELVIYPSAENATD